MFQILIVPSISPAKTPDAEIESGARAARRPDLLARPQQIEMESS